MQGNLIDSLDVFDISSLSYADVAYQYGTGRSIVRESKMEGNRRRDIAAYRCGVQTAIGDIRVDVWLKLAEAVIAWAGEWKLLQQIYNYISGVAPTSYRNKAERWRTALQHHLYRFHDNPEWVGYIPFNRKYRPEVIATADIIWIVNECCKVPGEITRQRYEADIRIYNEMAHCPHCGGMSACMRCEPPQNSERGDFHE